MTYDNLRFTQYCNIEFLFKYFVEERYFLRGHKALKVILGFQNERQSLEFVLELHSHTNLFSFKVENSVTEVNENDSVLVRFLRMSVLFPFEELVFTMQQTKVFTSVSLLLLILGIDAIKLINKYISTRSIYDEYVVRLLIDNDFGEVERVFADEVVEDVFDFGIIANIIMRHLKRPFTELIALKYISDIGVKQHLDHVWVSETASLVHRIVTILVLGLFLFFNQLHVGSIFEVFAQDKLDNFFLVILNSYQEG